MNGWLAKSRRIRALTRKETRQIMRDPSSVAIGIVFPMIMILLFGYGLSLDVTRVNVAVVDQDASADSAGLVGAFRLSPYFGITALAATGVTVIVTTHFMPEAEYCDRAAILDSGKVLAQGTPAELRARASAAAATIEDAFVAIVEKARGKPHEGALA